MTSFESFTSQSGVGFAAPAAWSAEVEQDGQPEASADRYSYAANNPYRFTDPDGRNFTGSRLGDRWGVSSVKSYVLNAADIKASEQGAKEKPITPVVEKGNYPTNAKTGEEIQAVWEIGWYDALIAQSAATRARADTAREESNGMPGDQNGPADAFRHCDGTCNASRAIGAEQTIRIGDNHENWVPNSPVVSHMDKFNNRFGANEAASRQGTCAQVCRAAVRDNELYVMPPSTWIERK